MSSLDSLPADQRAVLQLVLQRGRSYDDIAAMLSIDRAGVRDRALAALDSLGPQTRVAPERRALITDYLLGQLPGPVADQVRDRLAQSASERAWARVLSSELAPLSSGPLPEIPAEAAGGAPLANETAASELPAPMPAPAEPAAATEPAAPPPASERPPTHAPVPPEPAPHEPEPALHEPEPGLQKPEPARPEPAPTPFEPGPAAAPTAAATQPPPTPPDEDGKSSDGRPRSKLGGAILIGLGAVIVALIAIIVVSLASGGSSKSSSSSTAASHSTTSSAAASTATSSAADSSAVPVAQINLTSPNPSSKAKGVAEVVKEGTNTGILIVATGLAANSKHPPNAYAVWLYNSPTDSHILGFVNPGITSSGKLQTEGGLPANASHYKELIVTLETQATPHAPGQIILQGPLTGA
jgi:hypothetical protein